MNAMKKEVQILKKMEWNNQVIRQPLSQTLTYKDLAHEIPHIPSGIEY